jgi:DNA invertase Pin-like site-specific DNA recombinase
VKKPLDASTLDYIAGVPVWVIALRHGVTPKTVRLRARKAGVVGRKAKVSGEWAKRIVRLYRRGNEWGEIARAMEINRRTITEVLRREGVRPRTK